MKTIGIIGGMSWESTLEYYRIMNETVKERLGGLHSAKLLMYSVDFAEIRGDMLAGDWDGAGERLAKAARALEKGGADLLLIATNTLHKVAPRVEAAVSIPLLHIAEASADAVLDAGLTRIGLLGTAFTMEQDFYTARLAARGIDALVPPEADRRLIDRVIFDEMCKGVFTDEARAEFLRVIGGLTALGAQGIVLGCTEIGILVRPGDTDVPLFDTCLIHATRAVDLAL
ncbi:aspartate/glutamate racemase family protein [Pseudodesulfovibrio sp.]|uniref:aspartate/glutamate racemase family protein n=1 Tax=Pseudodesulfovibrio sp. TaxID=2035812 RepID=UPI002624E9BB|nr:aspartate/glutamate racemase family protein [Pseudodesulfovibrio sp.]MDD3312456.1 aspartate/glutamate racemase family protein [Pseudodesulfovibrio sp.]